MIVCPNQDAAVVDNGNAATIEIDVPSDRRGRTRHAITDTPGVETGEFASITPREECAVGDDAVLTAEFPLLVPRGDIERDHSHPSRHE